MDSQPYLVFDWHGLRFGIEVGSVQEVFLLPELTPIVEAPTDIVGLLNWRSRLVPVMHLDLRFGLKMQTCTINDGVVILAWDGLHIGIIANSVHGVEAIAPNNIEPQLDYGRVGAVNPAFIAGIAKLEEEILLLNPKALIRFSEEVAALTDGDAWVKHNGAEPNGSAPGTLCDFDRRCCPNATPQERAIFRRRAENLKQDDATDSADGTPFAVIALGSEYYGLELQNVREFINVGKIAPIPCCPSHIAGNINLRGEIVTLVDIRQVLNLPPANAAKISKAVVIEVDDLVAVPIDEVFDVEYFSVSDLGAGATASGVERFLRGTMTYSNTMLSILDLPKLLVEGGLEVDEE